MHLLTKTTDRRTYQYRDSNTQFLLLFFYQNNSNTGRMTSHTGSKISAFAAMENPATRFSTRREETIEDEGVKPSTHPTVNLQATHAGGYAPDVKKPM